MSDKENFWDEIGPLPGEDEGNTFEAESRPVKQDNLAPMDINFSIGLQKIEEMRTHYKALKAFISEVLESGKDYENYDFCDKPILLKPGAEKLRMLFGFGVDYQLTEKEVNRSTNFCKYTYKAIVTHLATGRVVATCEGTCNSQEKKYAKKKKWNKQKRAYDFVVVNIEDIENTIMKMAQKRAAQGATISATGASDFFTQDKEQIMAIEPDDSERTKHEVRYPHLQKYKPQPKKEGERSTAEILTDPKTYENDETIEEKHARIKATSEAHTISFGVHKGKKLKELTFKEMKATLAQSKQDYRVDPPDHVMETCRMLKNFMLLHPIWEVHADMYGMKKPQAK